MNNEFMKKYAGILQQILRLRLICDHWEGMGPETEACPTRIPRSVIVRSSGYHQGGAEHNQGYRGVRPAQGKRERSTRGLRDGSGNSDRYPSSRGLR